LIESIIVPGRTPFDHEQVTISGLKRVNFFFGSNGSGKTTLSRVIEDGAQNQTCDYLKWTDGQRLRTYVYNIDFVNKNFSQSNDVPGVFTIGEEANEVEKSIDELKQEIEKCTNKIAGENKNLAEAKSHLEEINSSLSDICWNLKSELPQSFKHAWKGVGSKKAAFRDKLIGFVNEEATDSEPCALEELQRRAEIVYDDSVQHVNSIGEIAFTPLSSLEKEEILERVIVGSDDVPISKLINSLGNSDWVASGRNYIKGSNICPFCQKPTIDDEFRNDLERFFDESYEADLGELRRISTEYTKTSTVIIRSIESVCNNYAQFIEGDRPHTLFEQLKRLIQHNKSTISKKIETPSLKAGIVDTANVYKELNDELSTVRQKVDKYNDTVENRSSEIAVLDQDIWRYCSAKALPRIENLMESKRNISKKMNGLSEAQQNQKDRLRSLKKQLSEMERRVTNVRETALVINGLLERFGFMNFKLEVMDDERSYRIVRNNGEPAMETLSEGETSFLTFLYFYQLANGSQDPSGASIPRVIVIDDPISSMDSDVLFIVSSLVRRLADDARQGEGLTKQLIVLTHNMTFYKEVTHVQGREGNAKTAYYFIRKKRDCSTVEFCEKSPITSTYEQLWAELFQDECSPLTAQNVARRIVETFFGLMGEPKVDEVILSLQGVDLEVARSFLSWANAGSHILFDDETFVNTLATTENYRRVLETIFKCSNYGEHYNHMLSLIEKRVGD
jgi:wobble nucleotide-excising tRNase